MNISPPRKGHISMIRGKVTIAEEICKGCELCINACPQGSLGLSDKINLKGYRYVVLVQDNCTGCVNCALVCPDSGITVYRQKKPVKGVGPQVQVAA
jgi:2-oxoglutarate ferredoxin oxidoreductase subunit delta